MQPTEKLYFTDSKLLEFTATVLDIAHTDRGDMIVLDRTAFYPTGGGQPYDTGRLAGGEVIDVIEDEAGTIYHVVNGSRAINASQLVEGSVDSDRRFDHLQQHTGQHILSQAFVKACGAETRSFHLGAVTSTIDIELQSPTDEHMRAAEDIANRIIFEDRPVRVHILDEAGAARLPLRKESAVRGEIRVIEVEEFDWSPCGGTHANHTGQIGLIAIKSFERAKKLTRVEFVCGRRALLDYRQANNTAFAVARMFSAERDSSAELVAKMLQENRSLKKRQRDLIELAATAEASRLLASVETTGAFKIIEAVFEDRDVEELRMLASKIVSSEQAISLLGTRDENAARIVFACSASLDQDMGRLLAEACQRLGGRGGGKPDLAQGGGPQKERLDEAIANAAQKLRESL
ncbi:MAG TPA: DHHA1 domain-containing protein [Blastocatellia bacterium]|nr:DHHA1 domain-containing protein [Blastocatellia bacterium]